MALPALKHEYVDPKGNPFTDLVMSYPDDKNPGKITLTISSNRTAEERHEALEEFKSFAQAVKLDAKIDEKKGSIEINTGTRSPEGAMLYISSRLEEMGLVKKGEAHKGIEAVLRHDDQSFAFPAMEELSANMQSAVYHAHGTGAPAALARSGAKFSAAEIENPIPLVAGIAGQNIGRGGRA